MSRMSDLKKAFDIFLKYEPGQWLGGAAHDIIWGPDETEYPITDADVERLENLGWFIDKSNGCWANFV